MSAIAHGIQRIEGRQMLALLSTVPDDTLVKYMDQMEAQLVHGIGVFVPCGDEGEKLENDQGQAYSDMPNLAATWGGESVDLDSNMMIARICEACNDQTRFRVFLYGP